MAATCSIVLDIARIGADTCTVSPGSSTSTTIEPPTFETSTCSSGSFTSTITPSSSSRKPVSTARSYGTEISRSLAASGIDTGKLEQDALFPRRAPLT